MSVRNVSTRDTRRDIATLVNDVADKYGFDAVGFLGGAIAESELDEFSTRERAWPDVSYGLFQPTVKWHGAIAGNMTKAPDGTVLDTLENRDRAKFWFHHAGRNIGYVAPLYDALLKRWGTPLEAWCRWNKPSIPGAENPNRANYERGLREAEEYRVTEVTDMPTLNDAHGTAYKLAVPTIAWNPDAAIPKRWLSEKAKGNFLGVPIGDEMDVGSGHRAQAFTSGALIVWRGGDTTEIA